MISFNGNTGLYTLEYNGEHVGDYKYRSEAFDRLRILTVTCP